MEGNHSQQTQALGGTRVLDITRVLAGPWAMQILGDLGAEIIKIERPGPGDESRHWGPPWVKDGQGKPTKDAAYFLAANRNKESVAIDIATPQGRDLVLKMVADCDIFVENYKVGGMKKLGLDYEAVRKVRPDIIYLSLTGFGQQGPFAERPGYDYLFQGLSGVMSVTGDPDDQPGGGPQRVGVPLVDMFTGMYATVAILAALNFRHLTGKGQYLDVSLFDSSLALASNPMMLSLIGGKPQQRSGRAAPTISPYGVFPASDGMFIVASANQGQWIAFCKALGHPDLATDPRFATNGERIANQKVLNELLGNITRTQDRVYWDRVLTAAGVPAGPINDCFQALDHPQARAKQSLTMMPHASGGEIPAIASPLRMSESPVSFRTAPPLMGQHTNAVLTRMLSLSAEDLARLSAEGVIQDAGYGKPDAPG